MLSCTPWQRQGGEVVPELFLRRALAEAGGAPAAAPGQVLNGPWVAVGGGGVVRVLEVQLPGGRALPIEQFVRGHPLRPGDLLVSKR